MKKVLALVLVGILLLTCVACSGDAEQASNAPGTNNGDTPNVDTKEAKNIAIIPWDMGEQFATDVVASVQNECDKRGWDLQVLDPVGDWNKVVEYLENLIVQRPDGIIYTAIDCAAAGDMVQTVVDAGIPIIGYDCLADAGNETGAVRCNDYMGGTLAAQAMMEALGGKEDATIVIYEEDPSVASSWRRNNGFTDYLEENYPNVTYIKRRTMDLNRDTLRAWAVDMVTTYPETDGIFAYVGDCGVASWHGLQEMGATDVIVITYDGTEEQIQLMKDGGADCSMYAVVTMYPEFFGTSCIEMMEKVFNGNYTRQGPDDIFEFEPDIIYAKDLAK